MDGVTLGQIMEVAAWLVGAAATLGGLCKLFNAGLKVALKPLNDKVDAIADNNKRIELEAHKNFLVRFLADVEQGDTMSKIMLECENTVQYGEAMDAYAKTWYSLVIKPGQSVYDGWTSEMGYGLYYNDDIEHRVEE